MTLIRQFINIFVLLKHPSTNSVKISVTSWHKKVDIRCMSATVLKDHVCYTFKLVYISFHSYVCVLDSVIL